MIALDAATGQRVWDVNTIDRTKPYTITGAPRVVKGKCIIGNGGAEFGVRGYVTAYDADTGELDVALLHRAGQPGERLRESDARDGRHDLERRVVDARRRRHGLGSMAYDPELDLLYIGVGNGSPWNHTIRSQGGGDNLFLSSIVALDPDDGAYVWHYQTTPGETWDYTATQQMIARGLDDRRRERRVIMQAPKNGFFYVLDAKTGELLSAKPSTGSLGRRTSISRRAARRNAERAIQRDRRAVSLAATPNGVHTWHSMAYSPLTGLVYIPIHSGTFVFAQPREF